MSLMSWIRDRLRGGPVAEEVKSGRPEDAGGRADSSAADSNSTTGTTPNDTFVGRASGADDPGYLETGAERRAAEEDDSGDFGPTDPDR